MTQSHPVTLNDLRPGSAPAPPIQAVVHTGELETRYWRTGSGPSVLLLLREGVSTPAGRSLMTELARSCRVFVPEIQTPTAGGGLPHGDLVSRLRALVDGLGLLRPSIVADETFALAALAFTLADPHRAGRLLITTRQPLIGSDTGGVLEDVVGRCGHPVLLLQLEPGADAPAAASTQVLQMTTFVHCSPAAQT
jgi:hypothetical protein